MGSAETVLLGVITDIQYADKQDVLINYVGKVRRFSKVLAKTETAVQRLNSSNVSCVLHLGDIIDGNVSIEKTHADLDSVLRHLSKLNAPVCHTLGNHCLDADRTYLTQHLDMTKSSYYSRDLSAKWRLIVLDTVDLSIHHPVDHPLYKEAVQYLDSHKGDLNAVDWNGGLSDEQFAWLENVLRDATEKRMLSIVCGHLPVEEGAAKPGYVAWKNTTLLELFQKYGSTVKAYFAGHFHEGGYSFKDGLHHVTFESILDSEHEDGSSAVVELHESEIIIKGSGDMTSRKLSI